MKISRASINSPALGLQLSSSNCPAAQNPFMILCAVLVLLLASSLPGHAGETDSFPGLDLNNQINVDKSASQVIVTLGDITTVELRAFTARADLQLPGEPAGRVGGWRVARATARGRSAHGRWPGRLPPRRCRCPPDR